MTLTPAFYRRTLLNDVAGFPELTEDCYIEWRPMTYVDSMRLTQVAAKELTEVEAAQQMVECIKRQFVSGKLSFHDDAGELELADMQPEHIDQLPGDLINRIFADMTGVRYDEDPKGEASSQDATTTPSTETS